MQGKCHRVRRIQEENAIFLHQLMEGSEILNFLDSVYLVYDPSFVGRKDSYFEIYAFETTGSETFKFLIETRAHM